MYVALVIEVLLNSINNMYVAIQRKEDWFD